MKYKVITETIYEDKRLWDTGETLGEMSKRTGIPKSYLSLLKNGKRVPYEETYNELRKHILGHAEKKWVKRK
jgi:hypothetical protein